MNKIWGYIVTLRHYLKTEKGARDAADYFKAIVVIITVIILVMVLVDIARKFLL